MNLALFQKQANPSSCLRFGSWFKRCVCRLAERLAEFTLASQRGYLNGDIINSFMLGKTASWLQKGETE